MKNLPIHVQENGQVKQYIAQMKAVYEGEELIEVAIRLALADTVIAISPTSVTELAVKKLQQQLAMPLLCCQSCRHGHYNPYGDLDNEIFCLKDVSVANKSDVCEQFADGLLNERKRALLHYCPGYQAMSKDYYMYNDWLE